MYGLKCLPVSPICFLRQSQYVALAGLESLELIIDQASLNSEIHLFCPPNSGNKGHEY